MSLFEAGLQQALDDDGNPIDGATWNFSESAGSTPLAVYADNELTTPLGSSVQTSGSDGRFPNIFLNDANSYKAVLRDAEGGFVYQIDLANPVSTEIDHLEALIDEEAAIRAAADSELDVRVDSLEATVVSGIRVYNTWTELNTAFIAYNGATAYAVNDTILDQSAFWLCIQASTGNAPPTLPTTSTIYWRLITDTPAGQSAQVSFGDDGNTHTDPVAVGNPTVDNPGIYRYSLSPAGWERIDDLDSQVAQGFAEDAEAAAVILGGAANLGDMSTNVSGTPGDLEWVDRVELSKQPTHNVDTSTLASIQPFNQVGTPGSRITTAVAGGIYTITAGASIGSNIPSALIGTPIQIIEGGTYIAEGSTNVLPGIHTGLLFAFIATAPTPGGSTAVTPAGTMIITMRGNGTLTVVDTTGALYGGASLTLPGGGSAGSISSFTTEECRLIVTMLTSTSAIVVPIIGGVSEGPRILTGIPANYYFGGGQRIFGATCAGDISLLQSRGASFDVPKRIYVDADASPGGTGSADDPFATLEEAQFDSAVDSSRRDLEISLMGGTYRGTLNLDSSKWRNIRITGSGAQKVIISPSVLIGPSGLTPAWTLVPGSTGGAVYKRLASDAVYVGNATYGGYVEVGDAVTQTDIYGLAPNNYTVEGWALYSRLSANTLPTSVSFVPGSYSRHNTGADAGYDFIRCWDDGDPNTKDFERSLYAGGINITPSEQTSFNVCNVSIQNIEVHYAFLYGINIALANVDLQHLYVRGSQVGYGYELDGCGGRISGCVATGCGYDGLHAAGDLSVADRDVHLEITDYWALGIANLPQGFGDGMSAHLGNRHWWTVHGGGAMGVGKDGAAMSGHADFYDYSVTGAVNAGITCYGQAGLLQNLTVNVTGGVMTGCLYGLNCNTATFDDCIRTINVTGTILLDNTVSVLAYTSGTDAEATVNALDVTVDGGGNKSTVGNGVINSRLSPTLV